MGGVPDRHFVVVGAQRCGTTYLRTVLDEHPGIVMATPVSPEPKAFLTDEAVRRGREWYDATWFAGAPADVRLGEKSTSYLELPETIDRIRAVLGDPQVVVQLRDPVARAVSNWQLSTKHGLETRPLDRALEDNLAGSRGWDTALTSVSPYAYLERGRYAEQIAPWLDAFGDRLRVLLLEELLDGQDTLRDTYAWLRVRPDFVPLSLGASVNQSTVAAPRLGSEMTARLREHFSRSDADLESMLGRPLPWTR